MRTQRPEQERTKKALKAAFVYLSARNATNFSALSRAIEGAATGRHLSGIAVSAAKGGRNMSSDLARVIAPKYDLSYEQMLRLGELIISGVDGTEALKQVRGLVVVPGGGREAKAGKVAVSQVAVATGNGNHIANTTLASIPVEDDIIRETIAHVVERMGGQNLDTRIAMRARIKAAIKSVEKKMGVQIDVRGSKPPD